MINIYSIYSTFEKKNSERFSSYATLLLEHDDIERQIERYKLANL